MTDNLVYSAMNFAIDKHAGKTRRKKGSGGEPEPFINHVSRVGLETAIHFQHPTLTAIAWLHDTVEDCPGVNEGDIERLFGKAVADGVIALTNASELAHWDGDKPPRSHRKRLDREKIEQISPNLKTIKLIDRIDNIRSSIDLIDPCGFVSDKDIKWSELYHAETIELLRVTMVADSGKRALLTHLNETLGAATKAYREVENYYIKKGLTY